MRTSIPEEIRLCQRIIEYAIKHNSIVVKHMLQIY